jgi:uncharacterized membrane protein HdeD (DUF308 family)
MNRVISAVQARPKNGGSMILDRATKRWWALVVRGILAVAFGVLVVASPPTAVMALVFIFGIYAIADGLTSLSVFLSPFAPERGAWLLALGGVVGIAAGIIALAWPGITAVVLFLIIAWWAIVLGVTEIIAAITYSKEIENEWAVVMSGILWVAFGVIVLVWPNTGVLAVLALIATFAIIRGVMLIVAGARLRRLGTRLTAGQGPNEQQLHR